MKLNSGFGLSAFNRGMHNPLGANPLPKNLGLPPKTCQWIEGEPRGRDFCCQPVTNMQDGRPSSYCQAHHKRVYVKGDNRLERFAKLADRDNPYANVPNDIDKKNWRSIIADHEKMAHKSREP